MAKGRRGRESAADMVRSLGLVLVIVGLLFFFARPPASDAKKIRVIDPSSDVQAFSAAVRGGAVPREMPRGWRSTVSGYDDSARLLRIGWVTPKGEYAEYAAADRPSETFVFDITGHAPKVGSIDVAGTQWQEYRQDGTISLVRTYGTTTVVLGTMRETATLDELRVLAEHLAPQAIPSSSASSGASQRG